MKLLVKNPKWFCTLENGDDLDLNTALNTKNIQSNIFEKIKFTCQISMYEVLSIYEPHFQTAADSTDGNAYWKLEGANFDTYFDVGDDIRAIGNGGGKIEGTVETVSPSVIGISVTSGTGTTGVDDGESKIYNISNFEFFKIRYGLGDSERYTNWLDGENNSYIFDAVGAIDGGSRLTTEVVGVPTNLNGHTGEMSLSYVDIETTPEFNNGVEENAQVFNFEHTFINQNYDEILKLALQEGDKTDEYIGDSTLDYFLEVETRAKEDRKPKIGQYISKGNIGYINESFNGGVNPYEVVSVSFEDADTSEEFDTLSNIKNTKVTAVINGDFESTNAVIYHLSTIDEDDYKFVNRSFVDLFRYETIVASTSSSDLGRIENALVTVNSATQIEIELELNLSDSELNEQSYVLGVHLNNASGKRVNIPLSIDSYSYAFDVPGLHGFTRIEQFCHPNDFVNSTDSEGFDTAVLNIEETVLTFGKFWLEEANKAELKSLEFKLVAYDVVLKTHKLFRNYKFDFNSVKIGDNQQIILNKTRGYILIDGDQFNFVQINTVEKVGTKQYYEVLIAWKVPYQSWLEFKDSDTRLYDLNESNYGLNQDSSRHFFEDYEFRTFFDAIVSNQELDTIYRSSGGKIEVYGVDEDETGLESYSCEVNTFNEDGSDIDNLLIKDGYTGIKWKLTPISPPSFSSNINFTDLETNGNRFAHGNRYFTGSYWNRGSGLTSDSDSGQWENNQANATDLFRDVSLLTYNKYDDIYDTSTGVPAGTSILANFNATAFHGMYSESSYENYAISGTMYSDESDDDGIVYVIAFHVDENGIEHTLSLCATTGGIDFGIDPDYVVGDVLTTIFDFQSVKISPKYALVYNFGKDDGVVLGEVDTSETPVNWNHPSIDDLNFNVVRVGKDITVNVSWDIDGNTHDTPISYDLTSNEFTRKFLNSQKYGFGYISQNVGGFKNVVLVAPENDFYSVVLIEPEFSSSENSSALSSLRVASVNNLLMQTENDLRVSKIEFVEGSFFITARVDTSRLDLNMKYKIGVQIAPLDNEL